MGDNRVTESPMALVCQCLILMSFLAAARQRDEWERMRRMKVKRERGWTGHSWGGISLGPPDRGPNGGKQTCTVASLHKDCVMQDCFCQSI